MSFCEINVNPDVLSHISTSALLPQTSHSYKLTLCYAALTVTQHRRVRFHGSLRFLTLRSYITAIKNIGLVIKIYSTSFVLLETQCCMNKGSCKYRGLITGAARNRFVDFHTQYRLNFLLSFSWSTKILQSIYASL